MHNKVVYRIARALRRSGAVVLRFNFRGVNLSEGKHDRGIGEVEDARAALRLLRSRYPDLPYKLAGFSFGSKTILNLGCETGDAAKLIAVGFPAGHADSRDLGGCDIPRLFVLSTHDEFCPVSEMEAYIAKLNEPKELILIEAKDHFFADALDQLEEVVRTHG